jgi:hypothetical protein
MTSPPPWMQLSNRAPRSVQLKLARVGEHLEALDETMRSFLANEPYATVRRVEAGGTEHIFYWERYTDPPDRVGLIAGDAIHNLRSSLDHLVVALAQAGATTSGVSISAPEEAGLQFPVTTSDKHFKNGAGRWLNHVDSDAQEVIEAWQPYNMTLGNPKRSVLWQLSDLDNADKHRALTVARLSSVMVRANWPAELSKATAFRRPKVRSDPAPGVEIGRFVFPTPQAEEDIPVECRWGFVLWIGYWPMHGIEQTLSRYVHVVTTIVSDLSYRFL